MAKKRRLLLSLVAFFLPALLLSGCASPRRVACRLTAKMLDPRTSPRKSLGYRHRLMTLAPHSDEFLAEAFFPIGLYDVPEHALPDIAAAGFNLIVNGGRDPGYLARAESAGLRVIPYVPLDGIQDAARKARRQRSILAWYLFDEPDLNGLPAGEYRCLARELRRRDSRRPIYLTVWSANRYRDFIGACDIFAPVAYPITQLAPEKNDLRMVARKLDAARAAACEKPLWAIVQAFWAEPLWPRNPTPAELRAMIFIALNHGADGIIYFSYKSGDRPITQHAELFNAIRLINGQLRALRGPLLVPPAREAVRVELMENGAGAAQAAVEETPAPPLDCSLRPFGGSRLLIAVNPDYIPKTVHIVLSNHAEGRPLRARELFPEAGNASPEAASDHPLRLSFSPYQVRLFRLD